MKWQSGDGDVPLELTVCMSGSEILAASAVLPVYVGSDGVME
ncbi:hypothetical protein ACPOL_6729 (plasmid) [Acidisarcina polymorpha]|uniref:Uncharacterized protein n=2 Tax=Acidisarcina polymorpha TaxID=2211140 RepID=A0A2Z5G9V7_9BACT|nr:hypothetical protein ACPOL_6729 [Acidisarcina polymorpha]